MKKKQLLFSMLFLLLQVYVFAQSRTITGTVKDAKTSETLPGVTVLVEGTTIATSTNVDGKFSINVEGEDKKLVFSSVGYKTITIPANKEVIDISFEQDAKLLKETVVTALGVSKEKKSLGYSVSEVSGGDLTRSGESNVIQGLASKSSGIQVISSAGVPGASSKIIIRGNSTFGNNQPLIVVDGVPIDNETSSAATAGDSPFDANLSGVNNSNRALDINPDDIESVTILKGPSAAILYGPRAGQGAILYTTKKGNYKSRKGLGVTLSSSIEFAKVNKLPELQNKYAQGSKGGVIGNTPVYATADPGPDQLFGTDDDISYGTSFAWGPTIESLGMTTYDNLGNFFKTAVTYNTNVAIDGGNDKTMYRFSYGNIKNDGIVPNTWMKRNSIRLNAEHKLSDKLRVGTNISYVNTQTQKPQNGSNIAGVMLGLLRAPASFDIRQWEYAETGFDRTYFYLYDNPLFTVNKNTFNDNVNRVFGNTYATYQVASWFDINYKLALDSYSNRSKQVFAVSSTGDDKSSRRGQLYYNNENFMQLYSDLIFSFKKSFNETWNTSLIVGNNIWSTSRSTEFSRGRNFSTPNTFNLKNTSDLYASNYEELIRSCAVFFDGNIDYKSKIFIGISGRNEWTSTYSPKQRSFFYPSLNTSVVLSELFKFPRWFSFAKVRGSYAMVGLAPLPYRNKTYYGQPIYTDGFTDGITFPYLGTGGLALNNTLGSANLKPEKKTGYEVGVDLRYFEGRINFDLTYYDQVSSDVLLTKPISPSSGASQIYVNAAKISNKGLELSLSLTPIEMKDFKWDFNLMWSKNVSKVLKLADDVKEFSIGGFTGAQSYAVEGQPFGVIYGTKWQRTPSGKLIINPATGKPYRDPKSQVLGNTQPDWLSGIRNTFTYKDLSFTFLWDIRKGGKLWNGVNSRLNSLGLSKESEDREHTYVVEGVYSTGVDADGYAISGNDPNTKEISAFDYYSSVIGDGAYGGTTENGVQDGGWVRLREVALSYRLNMKNKKYLQYIDLSVTGRNLFLNTKYTGVDPETSIGGAGSNIQGFDYFNNPSTKSFFFGVKLGI